MCAEPSSSKKEVIKPVSQHDSSDVRSCETTSLEKSTTICTSGGEEFNVNKTWKVRHCEPSDPLYQLREELGDLLANPSAELPNNVHSPQKLYPVSQGPASTANASTDIPGPSVASPDEVNLLQTLSKNVENALHESHTTSPNKSHSRKGISRKSSQDLQVTKLQAAKHIKSLLQSATRTIAEAHALAELFGINIDSQDEWIDAPSREARPAFGVKHNVSAAASVYERSQARHQ